MNIVEWAFGKRMTPAERLRKHQRSLEKTQRELDRERVKLENQEKKLIQEIKKSAKNGQMGACKIQAKDLVRTRRYIEKFYSMRTQLQAISLRIQTVRTNEQMMQAMKGATGVLGNMNRSMNLPALQRIAMEFEKENDIMDQRQEMMDDAIDDVTGLEDEAEGDEIVDQVLEEIGVDLKNAMGETPQGLEGNTVAEGRIAQAIGGGGGDPGDNDLQARLDSLRRSRYPSSASILNIIWSQDSELRRNSFGVKIIDIDPSTCQDPCKPAPLLCEPLPRDLQSTDYSTSPENNLTRARDRRGLTHWVPLQVQDLCPTICTSHTHHPTPAIAISSGLSRSRPSRIQQFSGFPASKPTAIATATTTTYFNSVTWKSSNNRALCAAIPDFLSRRRFVSLNSPQLLEKPLPLWSIANRTGLFARHTRTINKLAGSKRRSFSSQGGLLNRMFGSSGSPPKDNSDSEAPDATDSSTASTNDSSSTSKTTEESGSGEKRSGNGSPQGRPTGDNGGTAEKKRRSSGVGGKASSLLASAKNSLHFSPNPNSAGFMRSTEQTSQTPLQKLGKQDPALSVPQGQHNNSAGESMPGPRSTFSVGVWEDRNKKCRRTMEDTHAFLYNFLHTPAPALASDLAATNQKPQKSTDELTNESSTSLAPTTTSEMMETDNGYFAIFDGHAGTFAADWCGKKLHIILEDVIKKNPNTPIPELLDQTFTTVDAQLEKLPLKNSGCTAVTAVLRWEDRIPNAQSATGSTAIAPATAAAVKAADDAAKNEEKSGDSGVDMSKIPSQQPNAASSAAASNMSTEATHAKLRGQASRQRVLYTANVGDARIVLCRNGKALRLSYDHKGSDENEGKRIANAGGLILNNRVNGVLAVTRALGDAYMKDLVTGHPYTTETVIQPDLDEFIILACDGLWDVCSDQEAVDLVRNNLDPISSAKQLVDHALARFSTDNLSCMIVRLNKTALLTTAKDASAAIGVEGDPASHPGKISEAEKIVEEAKRKVQEDGVPGVGVSGSNSGKGHDPKAIDGVVDEEQYKRISMEKVVEEEPGLVEGDTPEMDVVGGNAADPDIRSKLKLPQGAPR
ncbi:hypothetical protein G7Y89_g2234 [Cudoniella acicularis]|uniref:PPM-type phosphatase domain-containing protein n=1 Tax=Cudoniella acicularis TaxID=354080 RepID=A0A8H4RTQ7_9HELO|nr:hypothetical protein G7Y89_g2234 [Cudoniella acicularis]